MRARALRALRAPRRKVWSGKLSVGRGQRNWTVPLPRMAEEPGPLGLWSPPQGRLLAGWGIRGPAPAPGPLPERQLWQLAGDRHEAAPNCSGLPDPCLSLLPLMRR